MSNTDKNFIAKEDFLKVVLYILRETFEGSPEGEGSAYLDNKAGVFNTLEVISFEQASAKINETTIAAQTEHTKFYLDRLVEFSEGRTEKVNWELSWLINTVTEEEWGILRKGMKDSYENVLRCLAEIEVWNEDNIGNAVAIIAHTAYHLGAIRQLVKMVRSDR